MLVFVFVGLKLFRPIRAIAGQWDVGWGRGDGGPGSKGRRPGGPTPFSPFWPGSTPGTLGLVPAPPANGNHPMPGEGGLEVCLLPGGRTPPGPDYIGRL